MGSAKQDLEAANEQKANASKAVDSAIKEISPSAGAEVTGLSDSDQAKKDKQLPKIEKFLAKVEQKKESAKELYKLGQYGEAVITFKAAAEMIDSAIADFPLYKAELN